MRFLALLAMLSVPLLGGCSDTCGERVISRTDAPSGEHSAVLFEANCGATTGFSTQVAVVDAGAEPDSDRLVFAADDRDHQAQPGNWGGPDARLEWLTGEHLRITYSAGAHIFQRKAEMSGVKVTIRSDIE